MIEAQDSGPSVPDPRFARAITLFNRGEFFESHEVMEKLWLEAGNDPRRDLYKGIIQYAAALYQWKRGRPAPARELFKNATRLLERYRPRTLGLDVTRLVEAMSGFFDASEPGGIEYPRAELGDS